MNWLIDNWYILFALMAFVGVIIWLIFRFFNLPTEKQAKKKPFSVEKYVESVDNYARSGGGKPVDSKK